MSETAEPKVLTREEYAQRWRVGLRSVDRWLSEGRLPHVRIGRRCIRIPVKEADAALEKFLIAEVTRS